ncbi:MAG: TatD family hydrolase [Pseudomonadales bacterium]
MIDIGVNLLHGQFDHDRSEVLERARAAGVEHLIITGIDVDSSRAAAAFAAAAGARPRLSSTAGVHPHEAAAAPPGWQQQIDDIARQPEVVAIGETGLDFHRNFSPPAVQEEVFRDHLLLARRLTLPVFVHDREAGATVAACLEEMGPLPAGVVVHCFTGARAELMRYLDMGCYIGITGWVCDRRRGQGLRDLVPLVPLDRLLIETDAPFLRPHNAPGDAHGRRNEPALLSFVAARLAEIYGVWAEDLQAITSTNARALFRLGAGP